jgi:hypothetical protein
MFAKDLSSDKEPENRPGLSSAPPLTMTASAKFFGTGNKNSARNGNHTSASTGGKSLDNRLVLMLIGLLRETNQG